MTRNDTYYSDIFSSLADAVFVIDSSTTIIDVNDGALADVFGYAVSEVIGQSCRLLFADDESFRLAYREAFLTGDRPRGKFFEGSFRRKSGEVFTGELRTCPLAAGGGEIVAMVRDISDRKRVEEQLLKGALHDSLTGLPGKGLFRDRVHRMFVRARRRHGHAFAVVFMDLDHFKLVNDTHGHVTGDQMLIATARRIESFLRPGDTVARFGGDEFALVLDDIDAVSGALNAVERIIEELAKPVRVNGLDIMVTASAGISANLHHYENPDDLIRDADMAMYRAKAHGRNRCEIFDETMRARAMTRSALEKDMRKALDRNEFVLHYHPIVGLDTMKIVGVEALIRWQHPERGLIPAKDFIAVAEETGLIIPIGEWILKRVIMQQKQWACRMHIAINISPWQFENRAFFETFTRMLRDEQADTNFLRIDITEMTIMKDLDYTIRVLNGLTALGIEILIDDFGTGYSSLGSLKNLPISCLKIDRSFIKEIPDNSNDAKVVKAAITLAHCLNLKVSAEGVEDIAQLEYLKTFECDLAQGYYFSKPMSAAEITNLLRTTPHAFLQD
ncbi:MAG TPA: EAL domain-containing protein [Dissulfurispiraceae bacterium]|nr:EAL domain-containing protein [Dissulfurispiraceae bacterium]